MGVAIGVVIGLGWGLYLWDAQKAELSVALSVFVIVQGKSGN